MENPAKEDDSATQKEFDFIERPSEDFFCPVTFELLLNPHQTTCCGNHLSEKAVRRLQRDGKPCPMCKEPQLVTVQDKFHKRRVSAVQVRCLHTPSGCEWVGEVGVANQHTATCLKRPWECQHCKFVTTSNLKKEHAEQCTKYPIPCPNECEVGSIPRCDVEKHCAECPLEPVACEFADVGCNVKIARRDLKQHMEESQQQHLLSATLLNIKLTKDTIAELNHQLIEKDQQLAQVLLEKDKSVAAKDKIIAEKDMIIAQKDATIAMMVAEKDKMVVKNESQLLELQTHFRKFRKEFNKSTTIALDCFLKDFSECQRQGLHGDWFSDPFNVSECELKLNVETKEMGANMKVRLYPKSKNFHWSGVFVATLQLMNQLGDHGHYSKQLIIKTKKGQSFSDPYDYITFRELYKRDWTIQYLKDDSLKLRMWIK